MDEPIRVINRQTHAIFTEDVWGEAFLRFLYGQGFLAKTAGWALLHSIVRWPIFSWLAGTYYDSRHSCRLILPFCQRFRVNMDESVLSVEEFLSFNDFFTRQLHQGTRPQPNEPNIITVPADGRYRLLHSVEHTQQIGVKGEVLALEELLGSASLAAQFHGGAGVIGRLCPTDCHRVYFPMSGFVQDSCWINGSLFSVNPIATRRFPWIFWSNRRIVTVLTTEAFGNIAIIEVGATNCGSIHQSFVPGSWVQRGGEKAYFKLGGSAVIVLFEPDKIRFAEDLLQLEASGLEILCHTGQPLAFPSDGATPRGL